MDQVGYVKGCCAIYGFKGGDDPRFSTRISSIVRPGIHLRSLTHRLQELVLLTPN